MWGRSFELLLSVRGCVFLYHADSYHLFIPIYSYNYLEKTRSGDGAPCSWAQQPPMSLWDELGEPSGQGGTSSRKAVGRSGVQCVYRRIVITSITLIYGGLGGYQGGYVEASTLMEGYVEGYICRKLGRKINADLNAVSNVARRIGYKVEIRKIESYIATHNGLKPITP